MLLLADGRYISPESTYFTAHRVGSTVGGFIL